MKCSRKLHSLGTDNAHPRAQVADSGEPCTFNIKLEFPPGNVMNNEINIGRFVSMENTVQPRTVSAIWPPTYSQHDPFKALEMGRRSTMGTPN
uniref:Uncharacterized protein n=1 Tax=Megaselia scalaris TaxID=36166 RepID=T1GB62_MEGSC